MEQPFELYRQDLDLPISAYTEESVCAARRIGRGRGTINSNMCSADETRSVMRSPEVPMSTEVVDETERRLAEVIELGLVFERDGAYHATPLGERVLGGLWGFFKVYEAGDDLALRTRQAA